MARRLLIAPFLVPALITAGVVFGAAGVVSTVVHDQKQAAYEQWEERQRGVEIIDAWCSENGIIPEELTPKNEGI